MLQLKAYLLRLWSTVVRPTEVADGQEFTFIARRLRVVLQCKMDLFEFNTELLAYVFLKHRRRQGLRGTSIAVVIHRSLLSVLSSNTKMST